MTDLHATVVRIAARQPMTLRGLTVRIPAPRQDADQAVRQLIAAGQLSVRDDGTVAIGRPATKPAKKKRIRRNFKQADVMAAMSAQSGTVREIAERVGCTVNAAKQHAATLLAAGKITVVGYRKNPKSVGYAARIYAAVAGN